MSSESRNETEKYRVEAEAMNEEAAERLRQFIEDELKLNLTAYESEME